MADAIKPYRIARGRSARNVDRRPLWQTTVCRCRAWLREFAQNLAWMLISRHGLRRSLCPVYRSSLAVLLHGLDRDVALSLLCEPVHCYSHATSLAWESGAAPKRSPLLTR
jgi:hypothetical protein